MRDLKIEIEKILTRKERMRRHADGCCADSGGMEIREHALPSSTAVKNVKKESEKKK